MNSAEYRARSRRLNLMGSMTRLQIKKGQGRLRLLRSLRDRADARLTEASENQQALHSAAKRYGVCEKTALRLGDCQESNGCDTVELPRLAAEQAFVAECVVGALAVSREYAIASRKAAEIDRAAVREGAKLARSRRRGEEVMVRKRRLRQFLEAAKENVDQAEREDRHLDVG